MRPTVISPVPQWDLAVVLNGLYEPPFEPLESVNHKFLSYKATYLLAITLAKRVSKLQAFSLADPHILFLTDRVLLRNLPSFRPMASTFEKINQVISLPMFYAESSSDEELELHSLDISRLKNLSGEDEDQGV